MGDVVGGLISGGLGLLGSDEAADAQESAARRSAELAQQQAAQTRADLGGYRVTGNGANNRLAELLGLTSPNAYAKAESDYIADIRQRFPDISENWTPYQADVEKLVASNPDKYGANTGASDFGSLLKKFTGEDLASEPGYQFRLDEGLKGVQRSAASRGGLFSGAAGKALNRYGSDYASGEYQNAFNRDAASKNQIYSMLSGTAGAGQNAAAQTAASGQNAANMAGNAWQAAGNASAAGTVGGVNAITGAIDNYNSYNQLNNLLNRGSSAGGGYTGYNPTGNVYFGTGRMGD